MERAFEGLRGFILGRVNPALRLYEDAATSLPQVRREDIYFGVSDALKSSGETLCAIWPETLEIGGARISGEETADALVTVTFFCRGAPYDELLRRTCRYAACLRAELAREWTLGGIAADSECSLVRFFPDCGAADRQAAAVELELEINFDSDFARRSEWRHQER